MSEAGSTSHAVGSSRSPSLTPSTLSRRAEQALGGEVYLYHMKMMLKEPYVGGAWEWHQDYGYWYSNSCLFPYMASCLIAIDRATKENGCLQVISGSHLMGRIDHNKTGDQTGADVARVNLAIKHLKLVYCEMDPGTALFFHSNLLHRSDANRSPNPGGALTPIQLRLGSKLPSLRILPPSRGKGKNSGHHFLPPRWGKDSAACSRRELAELG